MARVVLSSSSLAFHQNDETEPDTADQLCRLYVTDEDPGVLYLNGPLVDSAVTGVILRNLADPVAGTDAVTLQYFNANNNLPADGAVTLSKLATQPQGSLITFNSEEEAALLAPGTEGHVLTITGGVPVYGELDAAALPDGIVTLEKIADQATSGVFVANTEHAPALVVSDESTAGLPLVSNGPDATPTFGVLGYGSLDAGCVGALQIINGVITSNHLDTGAVTADAIGSGAVRSDKIEDGAVTVDKLSSEDVGALVFNGGTASVASATFADTVLVHQGGGAFAFTTVPANGITDASITNVHIADVALTKLTASSGTQSMVVTTAEGGVGELPIGTAEWPLVATVTGSVEFAKLTGEGIAADAIGSWHLQASCVTSVALEPGCVTDAALGLNSVYTEAIQTGAVTADAMAFDAVTADAILNGAVTALKLGDEAVSTRTLQLECVTEATIEDGAVSELKLADGAVTGAKVADNVHKDTLVSVGRSAALGVSFTDADVSLVVGGAAKVVATDQGGSFVGTWMSGSDRKWKQVHGPACADPLAALDLVNGYTWTWTGCGKAGTRGFGVTAQEFARVCPEAVQYHDQLDGLVVDYHAVAAFNLCAAKSLKREQETHACAIADLRSRVATLETLLAGGEPRSPRAL